MNFDFGKFLGSFGQNLMQMNGGDMQPMMGGGQQQLPNALAGILENLRKQRIDDLVPRADQGLQRPYLLQQQPPIQPINFLTGGY